MQVRHSRTRLLTCTPSLLDGTHTQFTKMAGRHMLAVFKPTTMLLASELGPPDLPLEVPSKCAYARFTDSLLGSTCFSSKAVLTRSTAIEPQISNVPLRVVEQAKSPPACMVACLRLDLFTRLQWLVSKPLSQNLLWVPFGIQDPQPPLVSWSSEQTHVIVELPHDSVGTMVILFNPDDGPEWRCTLFVRPGEKITVPVGDPDFRIQRVCVDWEFNGVPVLVVQPTAANLELHGMSPSDLIKESTFMTKLLRKEMGQH